MEPKDEMEPEFNAEGGKGGLDTYLQPGEELLISSENIGIKKFLFTACLTERRLFLIDQKGVRRGITAKEIPREYITESYLDAPPGEDPVLILSVKTADDEIRTMKLGFQQSGEDRNPECEEWMVLFRKGKRAYVNICTPGPAPLPEVPRKPTAPTLVWPAEPVAPPESESERTTTTGTQTRQNVFAGGAVLREVPAEPGSGAVNPQIPLTGELPHRTGEARPEVLYCHHCGKRIPKNANFCPFCGTKIHDPGSGGNPSSQPNPPSPAPGTEPARPSFWKRVFGKR